MQLIVRTARLALRDWTLADADALFAIYGDPRVWEFLPPSPDYGDLTATRARLALNIETIAKRGYGHWALVENDGGALVGSCGFRPGFVDDAAELELGFTIGPTHWGRGYATEIAGAAMRIGFHRFRAPRIWALTAPENFPSRKVLEKIGMRYEQERVVDGTTWAAYEREAPPAEPS